MAKTSHNTNVVRLPTAAPRQVKQNHNKLSRAARAELPRFPDKYIYPSIRAAMPMARSILEMRESAATPEMELLTALCAALDDTARAKVAEVLAPGVTAGRRSAMQASAIFRTTRMTFGESCDLNNAIKRLRES